jgi:ribonucleoside-triphosphate reductase
MIEKVVKRDGRRVAYHIGKIALAINKAFEANNMADSEVSETLAIEVENEINQLGKKSIQVETIQDYVEKVLNKHGYFEVARKFIVYRTERARRRLLDADIYKVLQEITFSDSKDSDNKRENANVNADTAMGTMLKYGSESAKNYFVLDVLEEEASKAHKSGDIHIHDLDFYPMTTTCTQIDLIQLFKDGFSTGEGHLREPSDILSYSALACIAIQANQNDQHGGQSIPIFDYAMAIGVRKTYKRHFRNNLAKVLELNGQEVNPEKIKKQFLALEELGLVPTLDVNEAFDKKVQEKYNLTSQQIALIRKFSTQETERSTYQAMEAFIHNLNTMHSRAGAQVPFSSINYGTDTTSEGRMVMINLLLATEAGLGNGETPIFPIQILKIKEGINYNKTDPNYDIFKLAIRVSAKRLFPNFSFMDAPFNLQYYKEGDYRTEIAYMGCRTRVIGNVYDPSREIVTGRGNLSFTSINLPRLGLKHKNDVEGFFKELDEKIDLVFRQLLHRLKWQSKRKLKNFPFLMMQHVWLDSEKLSESDDLSEVLKHGTLTVGFIGLAECLKAMIGVHHGESEQAQELGLKIIKFMREKCDAEAQRTHLNFSLIATPAEGLSGRFVKIDKKVYGEIPGITDKDYYTNSFHVPVYYSLGAFEKIKIEAPYHALTNAGHISYIELDGDPIKNLSAFESVVRYMKESGIGYGSINHPIDRDPLCGFNGVIDHECPKCHRLEEEGAVGFERIRRITGYLVGTLDRFNNAKKSEVKDRVKHSVKS